MSKVVEAEASALWGILQDAVELQEVWREEHPDRTTPRINELVQWLVDLRAQSFAQRIVTTHEGLHS